MHGHEHLRVQQPRKFLCFRSVDGIHAADGRKQHVDLPNRPDSRFIRQMPKVARVQQADAIHLHKEHDVAPALRAALLIVPGRNARDAHALDLVHARFRNAHRVAQRHVKIVVVVMIMACRYGVGFHRRDRIARFRRTGIHQDPHAGFACQQKAGMSQPFQIHNSILNFL